MAPSHQHTCQVRQHLGNLLEEPASGPFSSKSDHSVRATEGIMKQPALELEHCLMLLLGADGLQVKHTIF